MYALFAKKNTRQNKFIRINDLIIKQLTIR